MIAFMGALSYVLMLIHLPFKYLGFLEMEFSDLPAIVCTFAFGPFVGAMIEVIKNLLKVITASTTGGVGELANMVISICYIVPCGLLWKKFTKNKNTGITKMILSCIVGCIGFVFAGIVVNYFVTVPLYCNLFGGEAAVIGACQGTIPIIDSLGKVVIIGITPFNIVKGIMMSTLGVLLYRSCGRFLKL